MLLDSEVQAGEIYVYDIELKFIEKDKTPQLFQMVQEPRLIKSSGMFGGITTDKTNAIYENIATGELVNWGTHCFTTIERIKKQYENINKIADNDRADFIGKAYQAICDYEASLTEE